MNASSCVFHPTSILLEPPRCFAPVSRPTPPCIIGASPRARKLVWSVSVVAVSLKKKKKQIKKITTTTTKRSQEKPQHNTDTTRSQRTNDHTSHHKQLLQPYRNSTRT